MSTSLIYLLTYLPSLPELGTPVDLEEIYEFLGDKNLGEVTQLMELIDCETLIETFADKYFITKQSESAIEIPQVVPDKLSKILLDNTLSEPDWLNKVFLSWIDALYDYGAKMGSTLLCEWAKWEVSLRLQLKTRRNQSGGKKTGVTLPISLTDFHDTTLYNHTRLINDYYNSSNPMMAELNLDKARIAFLRGSCEKYTFSRDELIAYLLELRIHRRHAAMSPEKGRKILEEVTTL